MGFSSGSGVSSDARAAKARVAPACVIRCKSGANATRVERASRRDPEFDPVVVRVLCAEVDRAHDAARSTAAASLVTTAGRA